VEQPFDGFGTWATFVCQASSAAAVGAAARAALAGALAASMARSTTAPIDRCMTFEVGMNGVIPQGQRTLVVERLC
jgi:hypothetical protein